MSSTFINSLAEHIKEHYDLQKEELIVVFPNKRAAFYLRSRFKEIYHEDIWLPQMLSIQEATTQWSGLQLVDQVDMMFELIAIDAERFHNNNSISVFGSMATQMADDFDEIDQYNVDADHLFSYVYDEKKIGVWQVDGQATPKEQQYLEFFASLKTYYHELRHRLEQQGKGYYGMITRYLASLKEEELIKRTGNKAIIFAGFNALTPTEQKIIDTLYRNGHTEVIWDFDRYYVEDPLNEAGYFAQRYIEKNIPWKPTVFSDRLLHDTKEIHLIGVTGKTIQAKALQSLLQVEHEEDATVILADENLIIPVLNAIPDSPKYPAIKVSMGYPLRQTSLYYFVQEFFTLHIKGRKIHGKGWYLWPILRILDLELVKITFSKDENDQIDCYKERVKQNKLFIFKLDDFEACCESEDLRQFARLLLATDEATDTTISLIDRLTSLLAFIANKLQQGEYRDKLFLLNQVSETGKAVNRLRDIMERHSDYINKADDLEILYRLVANSLSIKLNDSSTRGLQIMGLLEARNLDFKTFFMVGVNEGVLPAEKPTGSFIPYHIKRECHLPDYQTKQAVYAYHFYRQLQNAERMYFLYNTDGKGTGGEPSRFLLQLRYELAQRNPNIKIIEETFANTTEQIQLPERLVINKNEAVTAALRQKIETDNPRFALAPTSISTYIQCPLRFLLKYVMQIKDNGLDEETQSNDIGTLAHNTLELIYHDHLNTLISKDLFINSIKPSIADKLNTVIAKEFSQGLPDAGYNYLNQRTLDRLLQNYLRFEEAQLSKHQLYVTHLEHLLHTTLTVDGKKYLIAGTADRIDHFDNTIRIIDYKTGGVNEKDLAVPKDISDIVEIPEKAMQLMIYKYLYLKTHPEVNPQEVTASVFALRTQRIRFDLQVNNAALNEDFVGEMERILCSVIADMTNPNIPFDQPETSHSCSFCDFSDICAHSEAGSRLVNDR